MIALDTNMLVRALVADHPEQVAAVRELIAGNTIFLSRTVLLETEWVLRARYRKTPSELLAFFGALLEADDTVVEAAEEVRNALDWYAEGADFADAMHLAACGTALMHTFDRNFCKAAREAGIAPEVKVVET
ncbi:type II toxin-antitoxin system VapC family toxin [Pseudothauera rhizosphaerae]|uniref:Ribonuclease VapC n=1 Tax=Pseudothauera rhizosphaerae TaxID=2565932 RepID=A0A4S4ADI0_9RHOO|nr:type II toxin-antitoxin system VapC family toxin [Pseudothauera rhizosphaerae]THF56243.1 type II toxin-antitoxin system VapC family toxin [Pseudothauera rhizosphaerae]